MTEHEKSGSEAEKPQNPLPPDAKKVHEFFTQNEAGEKKDALPCYEVPDKDDQGQVQRFRYYLGWPKQMLPEGLKDFVETTPYWGEENVFEDEQYYYYDIMVSRKPDEELSMEKLTKTANFYHRQRWRALSFLTKGFGGGNK